MSDERTIHATYRIQFHRGFTLRDALERAPYLKALGVTHVYASPLLKARPGSTHGYDVEDPSELNPEIGTEAELEALALALHERGMGLILDIVPNHMAIGGPANRWWWDVLRRGRGSAYASFFDIDWDVPDPELRNRVAVPVLGDALSKVLERGELKLDFSGEEPVFRYHERSFPLDPETVPEEEGALQAIAADATALEALLGRQHYLLMDWREGDSRLNYRRFFNITHLAGVRVEDPVVFRETHQRVLDWHGRGWIDGFRIDHPDGLRDPEGYLHRLDGAAPGAWTTVEKILEPAEELPRSWPVAGTTGYDFIQRAGGLFIEASAEAPLTNFYEEFTDEPVDFTRVMREKKRLVLRTLLAAELARLTRLLVGVAEEAQRADWIRPEAPQEAVLELAACFPVYRTYIRAEEEKVGENDERVIREAFEAAVAERPNLKTALQLIREILLLELNGPRAAEFVMQFQQLTGPAMAKGLEDTAFYCFNRFIALNEVGGEPGDFCVRLDAFHEACARALADWPRAMLATSTHDTKRSEDVRARLSVLSEMTGPWTDAVRRWAGMNERWKSNGFPDRNAEYLLYQTLVGAWPISTERVVGFMEKASREAKQHTTWTSPNEAYEEALRGFVRGILSDPAFVSDLGEFVQAVEKPGHITSLSLCLLKLTAPGVPDIYQGTELWDFSLVDPDNRRPVDYALRERLLKELEGMDAREAWRRREEGIPKLWLIRRALAARARHAEAYGEGSYRPLHAEGDKARHVVAFVRGGEMITVAPRLALGVSEGWGDTFLELPEGKWVNELTDEDWPKGRVNVGELLHWFPVALLSRKED